MDIHTQQLRHFMELAKCRNYTKAAMNLYIAQPALSQQIAELEKQLGVTLFERTSRSVSLTPAGEILKEACPEILNKINSVQQQLLSAQAGLRGNLTIGFLSAFQSVLPGIVKKYRECYPDVEVNLVFGTPREIQDALRSQNADIIFTLAHDGLESNGVNQRIFWREPLSLLVRKDHPFALSGGWDYSLLRDDTLCIIDDETVPGFRNLVQSVCVDAGLPITKATTSSTWESIAVQVETGMAVSIFSAGHADAICSNYPNQVAIPIREDCMIYCAKWNPDSKNAVIPLFLDVLDSTLDNAAEE